jgi:riboflavin kinase / FMN adenylyltransferase
LQFRRPPVLIAGDMNRPAPPKPFLIIRRPRTMPASAIGAVAAIGNFDGVHIGHRAVLAAARSAAAAQGAPFAVLTFEPHPRRFFAPEAPPFLLNSFRAKARLLKEAGVEVMFSLRFNRAFAGISAPDFVGDVLARQLKLGGVAVGADFAFGHKRGGDVALLRQLGAAHGLSVTVIDPVPHGSQVASSSAARERLVAGDPRGAAAILGRWWEVEGRVRQGDRRGRQIGFPTANLVLGDLLVPRLGVYAVLLGVGAAGGIRWRAGVANLGRRPTFGGEAVRLEAHLFDFEGDLYGRLVRVALVDFLRPEQKFAGIDALRTQIAQDSERARAALRALPGDLYPPI